MSQHQVGTGGGNDPAPAPNACQHGLGLSYASFITFMPLSQPEGMKHTIVLFNLLMPKTAMATWEKDSSYANRIVWNPSQGVREPSNTDFHAPQ